MRIVLRKPAYHTWTLFFHDVNSELPGTIGRVLLELERTLSQEPRPIQPKTIGSPLGRQCGLFYQIPYCPSARLLGWEYLGADSDDTVLKHSMQVAERFGIDLELE
jgi:hypothetical protein